MLRKGCRGGEGGRWREGWVGYRLWMERERRRNKSNSERLKQLTKIDAFRVREREWGGGEGGRWREGWVGYRLWMERERRRNKSNSERLKQLTKIDAFRVRERVGGGGGEGGRERERKLERRRG